MPASSDVFLSYPHKDQEAVRALAAALKAEGLTVWMDESNVEAFDRIHDRVATGIAGSRAVVTWYSRHYASSRPCQWELSAAWLCEDGERVLVVNPEPDDRHVQPRSLVDRFYLGAGDLPAIARAVKSRLAGFTSAIGDDVSFAQPMHYGRQLTGSNHFVGRIPQLWQVHDALSKSGAAMLTSTTRSVAQLRGFGGVGKSVLAEEYALRFGAAFPGGVFWLKAYGNDAARQSLQPEDYEDERERQVSDFASMLQIPVAGRPPAEIRAALAEVLAANARARRRSLWIVDDAPSGITADALSQWLSPHPSVPTLLTTRDRSHSSLGELIDIDVLSGEESFALLEEHRQIEPGERQAAHELLAALGHHALAVEIAASYLGDQQGESIAGFLDDLRHPSEDVLEQAGQLADTLPLGHSSSIAATLNGTISRLSEPARDLLCLASFLATAPIPKELIEAVLTRLGTAGSVKFARMGAVKETERYGLGRSEPMPPDALTVHALVARTARRRPDAKERLDKIRAAAVASSTDALHSLISLGSVLRQGLAITHARALSAAPATAEEAALLVRVANTDLIRGDLATADRLARRALEYGVATLGEEALETCYARSGVATVLLARGDVAGAHEIFAAVAPVFERSLPPGDVYRVGAQAGLAYTLAAQGDFPAARRLGEAALATCIEVNGPDHPLTLSVKTMLGQILHAQGDASGAIRLQQEVLEARLRIADKGDVDTLADELLMAQAQIASGQIEAAAPIVERAAEVFAQSLGEDSVLTLSARGLLLLVLSSRGDFEAARSLAQNVVPRYERLLGASNPATVAFRLADAAILIMAGDSAAVRPWLEPMIGELGTVLGPEHPCTLNAKACLALCLSEQGDRAGESKLWEEVAGVREKLMGSDHPEVLSAKLSLAQALYALEQYRRSSELTREIIPLAEARLGPEHQTTVHAKGWLAFALQELGASAGTSESWEEVMAVGARYFEPSSPELLRLKLAWAHALHRMQEHARSLDVMLEALPLAVAKLGTDDELTRSVKICLIANLHVLGQFEAACPHWEELLAFDRRTHGATDPQTITTARALFMARWNSGNVPACRQIFLDYFESFCRRDPQTLSPLEQQIRSEILNHTDWLAAGPPVP